MGRLDDNLLILSRINCSFDCYSSNKKHWFKCRNTLGNPETLEQNVSGKESLSLENLKPVRPVSTRIGL